MDVRINRLDIEKKAKDVRSECKIQTYGIKDIFALIEQRGIHHIRYPFGKDILLGFSTVFEGNRVIVSNTSEMLAREIFTIAHELGHIIYDFEDGNQGLKVDLDINTINEDVAEERAYYFANCFLLPQEELEAFIKYELKKSEDELTALDIVRIQIEFNASYNAIVVRLRELNIISDSHKFDLFNQKNKTKSAMLFKILNEDEKLIKPTNITKVPAQYLEYVISNYNNDYIPFSSLEKALNLLGKDAEIFKKDEELNEDDLDLDDIFEEFE